MQDRESLHVQLKQLQYIVLQHKQTSMSQQVMLMESDLALTHYLQDLAHSLDLRLIQLPQQSSTGQYQFKLEGDFQNLVEMIHHLEHEKPLGRINHCKLKQTWMRQRGERASHLIAEISLQTQP